MSERASVSDRLVALAGELRRHGTGVGTGELIAAERALAAVDPGSRSQARHALRATLCAGKGDLAAFDAAFARWAAIGGSAPERPEIEPLPTATLPRAAIAADRPPPQTTDTDIEPRPAAWSEVEVLRAKDFAEYGDDERRAARALIARIAARGPQRISRRTRPSRRAGHRPDPRGTLRAALRHAGEPIERRERRRVRGQRRLVLVLDVSGSMEPYSRMLLQYAQACVAARRRCEAFAFGTRLTRITGELSGRDPDRALARASSAVTDWSGGTRIGDALAALNREHGRRIGRGAVVVVLSDGWDRGDPEQLTNELARLARCAHRLVWLNPLKASAGYEPLTRGMVAALPHVDAFLAGNNLASLAELTDLMETGIEVRA